MWTVVEVVTASNLVCHAAIAIVYTQHTIYAACNVIMMRHVSRIVSSDAAFPSQLLQCMHTMGHTPRKQGWPGIMLRSILPLLIRRSVTLLGRPRLKITWIYQNTTVLLKKVTFDTKKNRF